MDLPTPDAHALAISSRLQALIAEEISAQGPIPFQRFMELALYAPGLGYYAAGARKFGGDGDFVTAPELGSAFAQCIGQAIAPLLAELSAPVVVEIGAGSGALAADLLEFLAGADALPAEFWILERSADLRERQQARLTARVPSLMDRVRWLDALPEQEFEGLILANEVLDALACARFRMADAGVMEVYVDHLDAQWVEVERPAREGVRLAVEHIQAALEQPMLPGHLSECVPELGMWISAISQSLRRGMLLLIDYGHGRADFYSSQRSSGTLQCHYRHRAHSDPYWLPGLNDVTASVDFTAVAEAIVASGLTLEAFDTQSGFLTAAGIEQVFARQASDSARNALALAQQVRQLMLPSAMGERFKVMAASRGLQPAQIPTAFAGQGKRHKL